MHPLRGEDEILNLVREDARPLAGLDDVRAIVDLIGEARLVLLGEASHGTHEFYRLRAEITRRLIMDCGFDAVAVEADWPDALRVSRYVQGRSSDHDAPGALGGFVRFPRWMWRNAEVVGFVEWLRAYNDTIPDPATRVGFYGLDLYSLSSSMQAVVRYLEEIDPLAAHRARARYGCFDHFGHDPQHYGHATSLGISDDCEQEVLRQLQELYGEAQALLRHDGTAAADELFYAQQNARVVRNAESYYRVMYQGHAESWNLRDTHMADTLDALRAYIGQRRGEPARVVVWAHNSHVGDARATIWSEQGRLSLGQLVREREPDAGRVFLLGFTTHTGTVAAASGWDSPLELKTVRPSRHASIERLLHESGMGLFLLPLGLASRLDEALGGARLERAIGVVYRPETELVSHYFRAMPTRQFDALVHVDRSCALAPLDPPDDWEAAGEEETFPSGL